MKTLHRYAQLAPAPYVKGLSTLARFVRSDFLDVAHDAKDQAGYRIPCLDDRVFVEQNGEIELLTASRAGTKRPHVTLTYAKQESGYCIRLYLGRRTDVGVLFGTNCDLPELGTCTLSDLLALDAKSPRL